MCNRWQLVMYMCRNAHGTAPLSSFAMSVEATERVQGNYMTNNSTALCMYASSIAFENQHSRDGDTAAKPIQGKRLG